MRRKNKTVEDQYNKLIENEKDRKLLVEAYEKLDSIKAFLDKLSKKFNEKEEFKKAQKKYEKSKSKFPFKLNDNVCVFDPYNHDYGTGDFRVGGKIVDVTGKSESDYKIKVRWDDGKRSFTTFKCSGNKIVDHDSFLYSYIRVYDNKSEDLIGER